MLGSAAGKFQNKITNFVMMGSELSQVDPPPFS